MIKSYLYFKIIRPVVNLSEVLEAFIILLTLPTTVTTADRSVSILKIIKTYLRNSIGQNQLSNILILYIEQHRTKDIYIKF